LFLSIYSRWDYRQDAFEKQYLPDFVTIIAPVGQHGARESNWQRRQPVHAFEVRNLTTRQKEAKGASLTISTGVDLCRKAAAASTKRVRRSPPFPPAA
jgi:hypothetical protein